MTPYRVSVATRKVKYLLSHLKRRWGQSHRRTFDRTLYDQIVPARLLRWQEMPSVSQGLQSELKLMKRTRAVAAKGLRCMKENPETASLLAQHA